MTAAGIVLFMIGASSMDSASLVIPAVMVAAGIVLIYVGRRKTWA